MVIPACINGLGDFKTKAVLVEALLLAVVIVEPSAPGDVPTNKLYSFQLPWFIVKNVNVNHYPRYKFYEEFLPHHLFEILGTNKMN